MPETLPETLSQIADRTTPADLLPRSLARAHRIRRNRALAAGVSAAVVVALAIGVAGQLGGRPVTNPTRPGPSPTAPSPSPSASAVPPPVGQCDAAQPAPNSYPAVGSAVPGGAPMPGLVGSLYFEQGDTVIRQTASGATYVTSSGAQGANVSPDGRRLAVLGNDDTLTVYDRDGRNGRTLMTCVPAGAGFEPVWSPDSRWLLTAQGRPGATTVVVVDVATGSVTPLPHQVPGVHFLWSADGRHIGYATGDGHLGVADADGGNARVVPLIGDQNPAVNPRYRRSFDPYSLSPDGKRMAVILHTNSDQTDGDIGRDFGANAVIDTTTGGDVPLPVSGDVVAVLFQPDGGMVIRTGRLTFVNAAGTVTGQVDLPAAASGWRLFDYRTT